jgi:hypothetical protein
MSSCVAAVIFNILKTLPMKTYGMEMDSYKSQILDGVLVQEQKKYEPVSQIACVSVTFVTCN